MSRVRTVHRCTSCGSEAPRWAGRCGSCGEWNTIVEELEAPRQTAGARSLTAVRPLATAVQIGHVDMSASPSMPTGVGELDRVLGGGLVPGSVTLIGGEPGIGKSTLLLQTLASMASQGRRCLLVSAEESAHQVRLRAERLEALSPNLWIVPETSMPGIVAAVDEVEPEILVVDSIQTVVDPDLESGPGSVAQVRECAHALVAQAKQRGMATVLVGHVTKEGALAGPRVLEHVVDTVLSFEGERHHALRLLRAVKHRFGPTGELGLFEMTEAGLSGVSDPGALFLGDRHPGIAGSVVVPTIEGQRPLLVELQALVSGTNQPMPRRSVQGLDGGRLALVVAVLDRRAGISFQGFDIYTSVVGGVRVSEPAADLAMALALASAMTDLALPPNLVAFAEVGLGGELRQVGHTPRRFAEAVRLGFTHAMVAPSSPDGPAGLTVVRAATVAEAIGRFGVAAGPEG